MSDFDPRLTPARPDIAAAHLAGKVTADRYVDGELREVFDAQAPVRHAPSPDAALDTEALKGERVTIYDRDEEGWCWGQLVSDGYVGWIPASALTFPGPPSTHKIVALRTFAFPGPSIKQPPFQALSLGCTVAITDMAGDFALTANKLFIPRRHVGEIGTIEADFVAVAERFLGVPYLWGGKTSLGLDCSGLVQVSLTAAGVSCPRDSDMQEHALGPPVAELSNLRRGDLLFWRGHVAIAQDARTLIHANAYHMAVASEPLADALSRIEASGSALRGIRRIIGQ